MLEPIPIKSDEAIQTQEQARTRKVASSLEINPGLLSSKLTTSKMPPFRKQGKEPKETVIYPSSKRPAPPFKPLRPSKVPRVEPESSVSASRPAASKPAAARKLPPAKRVASRTKDIEENDSSKTLSSDHEQDNAVDLARKPAKTIQRSRGDSHLSISSNENAAATAGANDDPLPSQSDPTPSIPQALLLRLLHESFADKNTKIDKHAIQVLQKYMEIFVREAIARAKHAKLEAAGEADESELGGTWLDLEDLEKVAPGLLCDF